MILTENSSKWSQIIKEELGVENPQKLNWMSQYARNHEVFEGIQTGAVDGGIYSTPLNTLGMGNPMMPLGVAGADGFNANGAAGAGIGNTGADFHNPLYKTGSGDIPMSTLTMALEVAAMTIGLELVPVIPANGPWAMLSYMDFPYAGGKLGRINETVLDGKGKGAANKPIYIKFNAEVSYDDKKKCEAGDKVTVGGFEGTLIGFSRIDNSPIVRVVKCSTEDKSIADEFAAATTWSIGASVSGTVDRAGLLRADLVAAAADHVQ